MELSVPLSSYLAGHGTCLQETPHTLMHLRHEGSQCEQHSVSSPYMSMAIALTLSICVIVLMLLCKEHSVFVHVVIDSIHKL